MTARAKLRVVSSSDAAEEPLEWLTSFSEFTDEDWARHDAALREERQQKAKKELAERQAECMGLWPSWGLPRRCRENLRGGIKRTKAVDAMASFDAEIDGAGTVTLVVLSGHTGCGKTTAASAWLTERLSDRESKTSRRLIHASELAELERFDRGEMSSIRKARRLVIDDLSTEYLDPKGCLLSMVDALLNARYADMLPTVMTTNLNAKAFEARYGERIWDRIREAGRFIELDDKSLRGHQR